MEEKIIHNHNGLNSPKIEGKNLLGFPIFSDTPTHRAQQGTIVLINNGTDTRKICAMLNGTWYCSTLT